MPTAAAAPKKRIHHRVAVAARRHYSSRGGVRGIMGSLTPIGVGAVGGIAGRLGRQFQPQFGGVIGQAVVGYFGKNDTLLTLAGMELGHNVLGMTGILGTSSTSTAGSGGGW